MKRILILLVLAGAVAGGTLWWRRQHPPAATGFRMYGNLELRQVELAFNHNERIATVLVEEGQRVTRGQVLATLDDSRLTPRVAQARAQVAAQRAMVEKLHRGSRPEEIAQARASVEMARAEVVNARLQHERTAKAFAESDGRAVSQQDVDNAQAGLDIALARQQAAQAALDLVLAGPRVEDIAQAEALLAAGEAELALLQQYLAETRLFAPVDGVVRSRLLEPGEMAAPNRPVFSIAVLEPKWVRVYVPEAEVGRLTPGMEVSVRVDSFPNQPFEGWIGFISPVAEFTPKSVQTEELRTSLVFEVRVMVRDPGDRLRQGMPATVELAGAAATQPATRPAEEGRP